MIKLSLPMFLCAALLFQPAGELQAQFAEEGAEQQEGDQEEKSEAPARPRRRPPQRRKLPKRVATPPAATDQTAPDANTGETPPPPSPGELAEKIAETEKDPESEKSPENAKGAKSGQGQPTKVVKRGRNYIQGLNVPGGIELTDLVKLMSVWRDKNYIFDDKVKGKVFIIGPFEITLEEAYQAFLSALDVKGFTIVESGKVAKIVFTREARQYPVPFKDEGLPSGEMIITQLIPSKYTAVGEIQRAIQPLLSKDGHMNVYTPTNTLIVTDTGSNIRRLIQIIEKIDVAGQQEKLEIVTLLYANCVELAEKLKQLFPSISNKNSTTPPPKGGRAPKNPNQPQAETPSEAAPAEEDITSLKISQIIPYERSNALIVIGTERGIESLKELVKSLDVEDSGMGPRGKFHVYRLEHANADELSQTLQSLITGTARTSTTAATTQAGRKTTPPKRQSTAQTKPGEEGEEFEGEVKIISDPPTNSLVVTASPNDFATMLTLIKQLDIKRRQVFVESLLMEITLTEGTDLGSTYNFITDRINKKATAFGGRSEESLNALALSPTSLTGLALGFRTKEQLSMPAGLGGAEIDIPLVSALISASANSSLVNILSTPHILTTDNEEAEIVVGSKVPFISGRFQDNNNNPQFSYSREDVGITLSLKPSVSSTNYVTLKLKVNISEVTAQSEAGITTSNRDAKTVVVVKDQQTVVLGGLMKNQQRQQIYKIPFLGDIPILGWLFKNVENIREKTNLLIFLTPYVINDTTRLNEIFFRNLQKRQQFQEENDFEDSEEFKDLKRRGDAMLQREEEDRKEAEREAKEQQELGKQQESGQATTLGNVPSRSRAVQSGEEAAPEPGELPVEEPPSGSEEPTSAEEPSSTEQLPPPIPLDEGTTTPEE